MLSNYIMIAFVLAYAAVVLTFPTLLPEVMYYVCYGFLADPPALMDKVCDRIFLNINLDESRMLPMQTNNESNQLMI